MPPADVANRAPGHDARTLVAAIFFQPLDSGVQEPDTESHFFCIYQVSHTDEIVGKPLIYAQIYQLARAVYSKATSASKEEAMKISNQGSIPGDGNASETSQAGKSNQTEQSRTQSLTPQGILEAKDTFQPAQEDPLGKLFFSPGSLQEAPEILLKRPVLPAGGLAQLKEVDLSLAPEDEASPSEVAGGRWASEDETWNTDSIAHDIVNVANAERLIDDLILYGRDRHGFDPQGVFDRGDIERLERYADWLASNMLQIPPGIFHTASDLADVDNSDVMQYMYGRDGLGGGLGRTPSSDHSSNPMDEGGTGERTDPVVTGGRPGGGGSRIHGATPGSGRTLVGGAQDGPAETGAVGGNQKSSISGNDKEQGSGSANQAGSSMQGSTLTGSGSRGADSKDAFGSTEVADNGSADEGEGNGGGDATSAETGTTTTGRDLDWDYVTDGVERQTQVNGLPPDDGSSRGGDDMGARILKDKLPSGVTRQEADLIGPAFAKTTGPDDKERPDTGSQSGSVSTNPSESRSNDVGGTNMTATGSGVQSVQVNHLELLLKDLKLWEKWQAGGPDPAKG